MPNYYSNDPPYRDMREPDGDRLFVARHIGQPHGLPVVMMPSHAMTLGRTTLGDNKEVEHPTVTIFALESPAALVFIPTADELEAMSEVMAAEAKRMRDRADVVAAAAIEKARKR